ncbi:MAG: lysylphosphatidylglycerol synthase transmembrane domain-containing protein, partial [Candidatus Binatia bacterium]
MRNTRLALKALGGVALGLFCLALAMRKVSYDALLVSLAKLDLRYLAAAFLISLVIQLFRAWRWQIELSPLKSLRYPMVWQVISVAYMSINVLPFRLGEPVRPLLMSWKSGLSVAAIVGNWVFEKMMDAAAMVFFVHLTLLMTDLPQWASGASGASLLLFFLLLALVVSYWLGGDKAVDSMLGRLLPAHARSWLQGVLASAREGLSILPDRRMVAVVFL